MKARLMRPDDAEIWGTMRHELWPGADEAQLRDEIRNYFTGTSPLQAVFLCEDSSARPIGFLELSLRSYSEGCRFLARTTRRGLVRSTRGASSRRRPGFDDCGRGVGTRTQVQ